MKTDINSTENSVDPDQLIIIHKKWIIESHYHIKFTFFKLVRGLEISTYPEWTGTRHGISYLSE